MAKLGIGILIIPQKPWEVVATELNDYRQIFHEVNGIDAPPPIVGGWTYCDENADRAAEYARKYIGEYWRSVVRHYELDRRPPDEDARLRVVPDRCRRWRRAPGGVDAMTEFFLGLQVWGTPEQCYERSSTSRSAPAPRRSTASSATARMPYDLAEASMRLFAAEVMPRAAASACRSRIS